VKSRIQVESGKRTDGATAIKQVTPSHDNSSETIIFDYVHLTRRTEVKKWVYFTELACVANEGKTMTRKARRGDIQQEKRE